MLKQIIKSRPRLFASIFGIIIFSFIPLVVKSPYYLDLYIITLVNAVLGISFLITLRTGLINMGLAAFWGVGAYTSAVLVTKFHLSFWISLPAAALTTAFIAFIIGYFIIGSGSTGFSFVILSSVIGMLFVVTFGNIRYLGGYDGITNIPPPDTIILPFLPPIEFDSKVAFFYLALVFFVIIVLILKAFYSSWIGRAWSAIGLNPSLAQSLGINIFRYKLLGFVVASGLAGFIGSFYAHYGNFVIPYTYAMFTNIYIQIYAILGGIGYPILGPIIGSAVMVFFPELFRVTREWMTILTGGLLIMLVLFLPKGLLSLIDRRTIVMDNIIKVYSSILQMNKAKKA